ncbi:hypothetical protein C8046_10615 [Serinibacter arcticus]|uniref:Transglutaminase-like domain-containing protein n=1 Tax=Serinibacter arcticus TaxID=1655435 RepID=A0A2U1ZVN6_9MICO|nr:DUF3488 and transglutaminase-like domain-containing protein [Serinibacter arcticus]PWD51031.1 hypothetical protein C8046_10615 [Serinibacter arcticus]
MTTATRPERPRTGLAARRPAVAPAPRRRPGRLSGSGSGGGPGGGAPTTARTAVTQVLAAVTLLASLAAVDEVLVGSAWWLRPVLAVAWVVGLGIGLRRVAPAIVATLVQVVGLALLVAVLFEVSTPSAVADLVRVAAEHIQVSGAPAGVVPAVEFVLTAVVGLLAIVVDALAVRLPALVAVPALAAFVTGSTFAPGLLPWQAMVLPAAAYVAMLASAGPPARGRPGSRTVRRGHAGSGADRGVVVAIGAVAVVLGLVATSQATMISTAGRLDRVTVVGAGGSSPFTGLVGDLIRGEDVELVTYRSSVSPRYLRSVALTEWTNNAGWSLSAEPDVDRVDGSGGRLLPEAERASVPGTVVLEATGYQGRFLPVLEGTSEVDAADPPWRYDEVLDTWHRNGTTDPGVYQLLVDGALPSVEQLAGDTVSPSREEIEVGDLDPAVTELAREATAGQEGPFAQALALQQWFLTPTNGFVYSLSVPEGTSGDALVDFLDLRRGYCEQYASAMAVMLRALDIPARVVIGFGSGITDETGLTTVSSHNAHAWVEVRFDGAGWVRFDPTPGGGGQGGDAAPGIIGLPPVPVPGGEGTAEPDPTASAPGSEPVEPTAPDPTAGDPAEQPGEVDPTAAPPTDGGGTGTGEDGADPAVDPWAHVGRGEVTLLVLLALVTGPQAVRFWRARRRMARVAQGGPAAAIAAWEEIEDLALDHARPVAGTLTLRAGADQVADDAHLRAGARGRLGLLVREAERGWFESPSSAGAGAGAGGSKDRDAGAPLVAAVADVAAGLEHHAPPGPWRWWFPPSLRRPRRRP